MNLNKNDQKQIIFNLLNDIEVKGKKNMNNLLAAIQMLEKMWKEEQVAEEVKTND